MDQHSPNLALERHRADLEILTAALTTANAALTSAADDELAQRIAERDHACGALKDAHGRTAALEAAVARADAAKEAEDERARQAAEDEARRAEEEQARREHEQRIAPLLAALQEATAAADTANATAAIAETERQPIDAEELVREVLALTRTDFTRRSQTAHLRAALGAETLESRVVDLERVDPKHRAALDARAQVRAMAVHREIADIDDARALFAAARVILAAAQARLGEHTASPIAASVIALDAATTSAERDRALQLAVSGASFQKGVTLAEVGMMTLEGRAHEISRLAIERDRTATIEKLAAGIAGPRGSVGSARGAIAIIKHARACDVWAIEQSMAEDIVSACGRFLAEQVATLVAAQGYGRAFRIATTPGGSPAATLPQLTGDDPKRPGYFTPPASPRDQIASYLGLTGDLADLAALVPELAPAPRRDPAADLARGHSAPEAA